MLGVALAILLAGAAFLSGMQFASPSVDASSQEAGLFSLFSSKTKPAEEASLSEFWRVWNLLEEKYVSASSTKNISAEEKIEGAIQGLVDSYDDPYTVFLPPADAEQFEADISGNFGGVGMEVGLRDKFVTVIAPLPDTPAEKAGILAGDTVVKIDDTDTAGMGIDEAVRLIRGEVGTDVILTVFREGELDFLEITITRDLITIPTIETSTEGDVFVINLYNFNALSEEMVKEALSKFRDSGKEKLVLDLRGNPGGFLQSAVAIASNFLPAGKVVVRENFGENLDEQVYRSSGRIAGDFNSDNFVVLINGGSASASEILAGALKEHEVATTIGDTTFGKGSVQELVDLPSGSSLKVTVARWLTPNGISFSDGGLEPNVKIGRTPQQVMEGEDPQLAAALAWLSGERDFATEETKNVVSDTE